MGGRDPDAALTRVSAAVSDWSGGIIGASLREFNLRWARRVLRSSGSSSSSRTAGIAAIRPPRAEMARLHAAPSTHLARPLTITSPWPGACAAYPFIDDLVPVDDLAGLGWLEELLAEMAELATTRSPSSHPSLAAAGGAAAARPARCGAPRELLATIATWQAEGLDIARAVVVRTQKVAPRREAALLGWHRTVVPAGSVSGGCVEGATVTCIEEAREWRAARRAIRRERRQGRQVGLACGGVDDVSRPSPAEVLEAARALASSRTVVTMLPPGSPDVTTGSSAGLPEPMPAPLVISDDGKVGGAARMVEVGAIADAAEAVFPPGSVDDARGMVDPSSSRSSPRATAHHRGRGADRPVAVARPTSSATRCSSSIHGPRP